jgi:hypothetical protein
MDYYKIKKEKESELQMILDVKEKPKQQLAEKEEFNIVKIIGSRKHHLSLLATEYPLFFLPVF